MTPDNPTPTVLAALVGVITALSGLVGLVLRWWRADVRKMLKDAADERAATAERQDRVFGQMTGKLAKIGTTMVMVERILTDLTDRIERLERTDEHRPLPDGRP